MPAAPSYAADLKANNLYKNAACGKAVNDAAAKAYAMGQKLGYAQTYNKAESSAFDGKTLGSLKGFGKI